MIVYTTNSNESSVGHCYCSKCKSRMDPGDRYCRQCGRVVGGTQRPKDPPTFNDI